MQFGASEVESAWPTTVVAPQSGGAPPSKWTRKTRPWIASLPTAVVSSMNLYGITSGEHDNTDPTDTESTSNHPPHSLPDWSADGTRGEGSLMRSVARSLSGPYTPVADAEAFKGGLCD